MIRIVIIGICGKMGQTLKNAITEQSGEFTVVAGVDRVTNDDASCPVYADIFDITEAADVVIDFSRPEALTSTLAYCKERKLRAIIGTTGLTDDDKLLIDSYAAKVPIFFSGNMSLGVNLQLQLCKTAASTLGEAFEPEIVEKHHHLKVDAPSGTALMLADAISSQYTEGKKYMYGRYTRTDKRKVSELGIHSVRGGTIVGEHDVYFIGPDEIVEINHRAFSKLIFAQGALRAAAFINDKQPGLYSMRDILLENDVMSHIYVTDEQGIIRIRSDQRLPLSKVFNALADARVFVDMICVSNESEVAVSVNGKQLYAAAGVINTRFPELHTEVLSDLCKLTVEGKGMELTYGVAASVFDAVALAGIEIFAVTTSETKVQMAILSEDAPKAIKFIKENADI